MNHTTYTGPFTTTPPAHNLNLSDNLPVDTYGFVIVASLADIEQARQGKHTYVKVYCHGCQKHKLERIENASFYLKNDCDNCLKQRTKNES